MGLTGFTLNQLFMGFIGSMLTFGQMLVDLLTGQWSIFPKVLRDVLNSFTLPSWVNAFFSNNFVVVLIGGTFGTIILGVLMFKLAMRLIQLINPIS